MFGSLETVQQLFDNTKIWFHIHFWLIHGHGFWNHHVKFTIKDNFFLLMTKSDLFSDGLLNPNEKRQIQCKYKVCF